MRYAAEKGVKRIAAGMVALLGPVFLPDNHFDKISTDFAHYVHLVQMH